MTASTDVETDTDGASRPTPADRLRMAAVGASAAAMVLVPTMGPLIAGTGEGAEDFDTEITPPDYAFTIWAPIFLGVAGNAVQHAVNPTASVNRRTGWWLAGAYSANAAWSIAAQSGRFRYTPFILPVAASLAATAHCKAQHLRPRRAEHLVAHSTGLLLGWTSVASVVNVFATRRRAPFAPTTRTGRSTARLAVAGAAAALSAAIATSRRGHTSIALASTWALATNAANSERATQTRQINAAGASLIGSVTAIKLWTRRRWRGQRNGPSNP